MAVNPQPTDDDSPVDDEFLDALRLNLIAGVGPRLRQALLDRFGSPTDILDAKLSDLRKVPGIGPKLARTICEQDTLADAQVELARCRERGITLIPRGRSGYPALLEEIPDPPTMLYCWGQLLPRDELCVGIVGSRRCTVYGRRMTERFSQGLARAGITVVSGLARGIDGVAHRGALAVDGRTIAVTATGHGSVYPPEHAELAKQISRQGAVLTEMPFEQKPIAGLFPQRNRIISGISQGVLIVEASRNSGALHTARHAMEQGRSVMALPGPVDSLASEGCHDLIRDGVTLVRHVDDVLEALGPLSKPAVAMCGPDVLSPRELSLNEQEREVLGLIALDPKPIDEILRSTTMEASRVLATVTVLEMKRMIRRLPGSQLVRTPS